MLKLYLSNFEVCEGVQRNNDYDLKVPKLLDKLYKKNISIVYLKEFESYDIIEKEIAGCDCLLAIVDEYWTSSTWKAIEVTFANGHAGSGLTKNFEIEPIPIFIFPVYKEVNLAFLRYEEGITILPSDVDRAIEIITAKLLI